jgi:hypothetical protein
MLRWSFAPGRPVAALFLVCLLPAVASAQDDRLRIPTIAASAAAAADWASTYHALKYYKVREANPILRPLDGSPLSLITVGGLIDAGAFSVWNVTVGRKNERVAVAGLWAMTAFRAFLVIHNIRNERRSERR